MRHPRPIVATILAVAFATIAISGCSAANCSVDKISVTLVDQAGNPFTGSECTYNFTVTYSQDSVMDTMDPDTSKVDACVFTRPNAAKLVYGDKPININIAARTGSNYKSQTVSETITKCGGTIAKTVTMQPTM